MIQFANPAWLWGLLGLMIPVGIHLLSRKEGKVIPIGSLRHLKESDTAQFSSIRLNEVLLLLLRCLLITVVVLMLAGTAIRQTTSAKKWLILERGIERERMAAPLIDSLSAQGYELRRLAEDFPLLEDTLQNDQTVPDYWALAEALAAKSRNDIIVLSYNYMEGFKGKRESMPDNIRWITYEPAPATYVAKAVATGNDSVWIRTAQTSAEATNMLSSTTENASPDTISVDRPDTIKISLFYDLQFEHDAKIIEACFGAVQTVIPYKVIIDKKTIAQYKPTGAGWTIWLADQVPPVIKTPLIAYNSCAGNLQPVILRGEQARVFCNAAAGNPDWMITRRLTEGLALDENLSLTLASILLSDRYKVNEERDKRQLAEQATWAVTREKKMRQADVTSTPIESFLAVVLLLCLIAERWLAFNRNQ